MTQEEYEQALNEEILKRTQGAAGLFDLADANTWDLWNNNVSIEEAATEVLEGDDLAMMFQDVWS